MNSRTKGWTKLLVGLALLLLPVGCSQETPTPTPASLVSASAVQSTVTLTPSLASSLTSVGAAVTPNPISSPTASQTATVTSTAVPVTLTLLERINVRAGPGLAYPILGALADSATAVAIGRSPDSLWWLINCPATIDAAACWLTADAQYVTAVGDLASLAVATAAPPPSPTLTPTATPCLVVQPRGWSAYRVRSGDTLSWLARQTGADVAELKAVNCLDSDLIVEGSILQVPGGLAAAPAAVDPSAAIAGAAAATDEQPPVAGGAGAAPSERPGVPPSAPAPLPTRPSLDFNDFNELLAQGLQISLPGGSDFCMPKAASTPDIFIGHARTSAAAWEPGESFGICLNGAANLPAGNSTVVTFSITSPVGKVESFAVPSKTALRWTVAPGDPPGLYTVTVQQAPEVQTSFTVSDSATASRLAVFNRSAGRPVVAQNSDITVVAAGYSSGPLALNVCQADAQETKMLHCFRLHNVFIDPVPSQYISFSSTGLDPGTYIIYDDSAARALSRSDPRIFDVR